MDKLATGECRVGLWGQWQVAKLPAFIGSVSSRLISKLTDRQIDRRTHTHPASSLLPPIFPPSPKCHPTQCGGTRASLFAYFHRLFGISFFLSLLHTFFLSLFCHCCLQLLSSKSSDRICCSFRCHIFILYSLLVGGDLLTFDAICLSMVNEVKLCWT